MKYSIDDIRREYDRLDKLLGIDTRNITLSVSSRCVRRYGVCRYDKDRMPKEICITDFIMECEDSFGMSSGTSTPMLSSASAIRKKSTAMIVYSRLLALRLDAGRSDAAMTKRPRSM